MATKYVVMYKITYADGDLAIYEFFRDSKPTATTSQEASPA
jgi:hypothetical protein